MLYGTTMTGGISPDPGTGSVGAHLRGDGINVMGPTDAWFTLNTVSLTNSTQRYFDTSAPGQPRRLYRLVPVP